MAFPYLLASLISVQPDFRLDPRAILFGLGAGLLTTLLFTLPPLLDIRTIRPILILRRSVDDLDQPVWRMLLAALQGKPYGGDSGLSLNALISKRLRRSASQIVALIVILAGLSAIALRVSDSREVARDFSLGLVAILLVLLLAAYIVLKVIRFLLTRTRLLLPSAVRQGLANLYRPGNPSAALLAALGTGVMMIMTVFLMQHAAVRQLQITSSPNLPNVFLIDIANDEIDGMRKLLKGSSAVTAPPEMLPVVSSRIVALDGVDAAEIKTKNFPHRMLRNINLTWAPTPPPGLSVVEGKWWDAQQGAAAASRPLVAVAEVQAKRLGLHLGSTINFAAQDRHFDATVVAFTRSDGQHAFSRAEFVLPEQSLKDLPIVWYGGVHADPARVGELQRALYAAYPTVTVINVAQALETIRAVVIQIIYVVQFLAAFSIFAGHRDPGFVDCRYALSPYPRGGGAEDPGGHARADCDGLLHRICGAGRGRGPGRRLLCRCRRAFSVEGTDHSEQCGVGLEPAWRGDNGCAYGGYRLAGEPSHSGPEAA